MNPGVSTQSNLAKPRKLQSKISAEINVSEIVHYIPSPVPSVPQQNFEIAEESEDETKLVDEISKEDVEVLMATEGTQTKERRQIIHKSVFDQQKEAIVSALNFKETKYKELLQKATQITTVATLGHSDLSSTQLESIALETENEFRNYLRENDIDLNWLKLHYVMQ